MRPPSGEMPFLDHLEELRLRILRALAGLIAGFGVGLLLVQRFRLVQLLKEPIAPYLPDGKLVVLSPTDPIMIVLKLSFVTGLVLASPWIIWQIWAFLSPALYERERKALVPSLFVGLLLFLAGALAAWVFVVPQALRVLLSFQTESFSTLITYEKYFGFVMQIVLAMGISAELPLLMILLAALGVVTPAGLGRFRRVAVVLAFVAGSVLSPGADVFSMLMMTLPLLVLYEVGLAGAVIAHRRQLRKQAATILAVVVLAAAPAGGLAAQEPQRPPVPAQAPGDTVQGARVDTAAARRLGLPSAPGKSFLPPDSVMAALLRREGFLTTRYLADTALVSGVRRGVRLSGNAMTERRGAVMEAEAISYVEDACDLVALGDPRLFDQGSVLIGGQIRYDTCRDRGLVDDALTSFSETGANWFVRGNLGVDSLSSRLFAASSEITSCDLPQPHYHFAAKEVKWVSKSLLVARPAVLYIRDVPVMWIPFIFQETKPGRRSGILVPQFGFNDIVRTNPGYNRQVTDFGYYWALSDYVDVAARFDWYAKRYFRFSAATQYKVLDRFIDGNLEFSRQAESGGSTSIGVRWNHRQTFNLSTSLNIGLNFSSNTRVVSQNAIDPFLNTQQLASDANFTKRFGWGTLTLGGRRRQTLGDDQVSQQFPSIALTPKPIDLGSRATWSPTVNFSNDQSTGARTFLVIPRVAGGADSVEIRPQTRTSLLTFDTPLRVGSFNWRNALSLTDREQTTPSTFQEKVPNEATPDPTDSVTVTRVAAGTFATELTWDTGINLPLLFRSTWKVTPSVGVANTTAGPFAVRNERTDGRWVTQGKRFAFGLSAAPTFFALFPGVGPVDRIRHSVQPLISWSYSPEAAVPEEYARAVARGSQPPQLLSPPTQTLTVSLNQNFEAKERPAPGDTVGATPPRKFRILGINTSGVTFDIEQAKQPGKTGWVTQTLSNTLQSDLLPGFSLALTHDLWRGTAGLDTASFDPFLQSVSASFALSGQTLRGIGGLFGLGGGDPAPPGARPATAPQPTSYITDPRAGIQGRSLAMSNLLSGARRPFSATVNVSITRARPLPEDETGEGQAVGPSGNSNLGFSTSFSPTRYWGVSWTTQYDITNKEFAAQIVRLERDMHDWRAGFNFVRNPNGNFAFYFSVHLIDMPDIKLDYNQTTISR